VPRATANAGPNAGLPPPAVAEVLTRLHGVYGPLPWRPSRDPIGELVLTILSQHTSDRLSGRAFAELLQNYPDWEAVRQAPTPEIRDAIRFGGLSEVKAPRLKQVLTRIREQRGDYDLNFLADLPIEEAREWLLALPGVGPKTAACVLMFALGRPAPPVDTHVYRVAQRLGLVPAKMSADKAHAHLEAAVPADDVYAFHIGLIRHGRYVCTARAPRCGDCVLATICPSAFSPAFAQADTTATL
jgi:endonuclease III